MTATSQTIGDLIKQPAPRKLFKGTEEKIAALLRVLEGEKRAEELPMEWYENVSPVGALFGGVSASALGVGAGEVCFRRARHRATNASRQRSATISRLPYLLRGGIAGAVIGGAAPLAVQWWLNR